MSEKIGLAQIALAVLPPLFAAVAPVMIARIWPSPTSASVIVIVVGNPQTTPAVEVHGNRKAAPRPKSVTIR